MVTGRSQTFRGRRRSCLGLLLGQAMGINDYILRITGKSMLAAAAPEKKNYENLHIMLNITCCSCCVVVVVTEAAG